MLHRHCGDCSAYVLRRSGVPGEVAVWCDPVIEGPAPAGVSPEGWLAGREDRVRLNGIDRWLGGIHLLGRGPVWRWHAGQRRLVGE